MSEFRDIPGYESLGLLGRGGMGAVFRARQTELDRVLAVKMIPSGSDLIRRQRFLREIRSTMKLSHPHLVEIMDCGETEEIVYYAMNLVEGISLSDMAHEEGALEVNILTQITRQLLSVLGYLHNKKFLHRDIKPANVMIDVEGQAILMDLGLVGGGDNTVLTRPGEVLGTPRYLAPELITGREFSRKTDVYALGLSLYEAATALQPYPGAASLADLFKQIVTRPLEPIRHLRPDLPAPIVEVIEGLMERKPDQRWTLERARRHLERDEVENFISGELGQQVLESNSSISGVRTGRIGMLGVVILTMIFITTLAMTVTTPWRSGNLTQTPASPPPATSSRSSIPSESVPSRTEVLFRLETLDETIVSLRSRMDFSTTEVGIAELKTVKNYRELEGPTFTTINRYRGLVEDFSKNGDSGPDWLLFEFVGNRLANNLRYLHGSSGSSVLARAEDVLVDSLSALDGDGFRGIVAGLVKARLIVTVPTGSNLIEHRVNTILQAVDALEKQPATWVQSAPGFYYRMFWLERAMARINASLQLWLNRVGNAEGLNNSMEFRTRSRFLDLSETLVNKVGFLSLGASRRFEFGIPDSSLKVFRESTTEDFWMAATIVAWSHAWDCLDRPTTHPELVSRAERLLIDIWRAWIRIPCADSTRARYRKNMNEDESQANQRQRQIIQQVQSLDKGI